MMIADHPIQLRTLAWSDYALINSGNGKKLERYGDYMVIRPEPQCWWTPKYPALWDKADAIFDPTDEDDDGRWQFSRKPADQWALGWNQVKLYGRFTSFRHLAFFPEQAANWTWQTECIERRVAAGRTPHILNLFGYTGVASLACAVAGAKVTHVDASKKSVGWARENATLSGMEQAPIRWICEDARKYVQREVKRGSKYEGIILDPPKYGRGPTGEVWRLFEDLPELIDLCAQLLSDDAAFLLLNAYAARVSGPALAHLLAEAVGPDKGGQIDYGELTLVEQDKTPKGMALSPVPPREIGLSFFARWMKDKV
ncbi:class I SAM-dependent methyltransferase [Asticcacaulis sp. ZE23SCel15]|uniref:class I SAM-dependent methyltransferase n=1 Tax=Asticcacaulis sp. ZE23SCel15 TaxID=3059027 RepID=UPI00265F2E39|nr:class I SAM-dependent methyltransferase [Asticcacaulis sp. ZE23SCel15]WKL56469.1 class I SAM-dependent methyltransferase [Asticcacaulis sp. ZE23SCel15]